MRKTLPKHIREVQDSNCEITIKEIFPRVFHLEYPSQKELTLAFCRFQEYYESPEFRNKIFTWDEYATWYQTHYSRKSFTYYRDWSGFNIPSKVLKPFYNKTFKGITKQEQQILKLFKDMQNKRFYIIGTYKRGIKKDLEATLKHEVGHALYYVSNKYRKNVNDLIDRLLSQTAFDKISKDLEKMGYHPSVFKDEIHAYTLANLDELTQKGFASTRLNQLSKGINKVFEEVYQKDEKNI
jgi:hypothetical protein